MNRIVHRIGALLAVLLMLWLSGTGSLMQLLDLKTVLTHASPVDPTVVSMAEGMYGPGNYAVIQLSDFSAASLGKDFDINRAVDIVLRAAHGSPISAGGQRPVATWLELRVIKGMPVGQIMKANQLEAFNAQTGLPVAAVPPDPIPQGARLPPSLRQKVKTLHRFWNRGDTPGVYFEFLSGLVLWTLLVTGLVMYFRLLSARARIGRRQLIWLNGGKWRALHRAISVLAGVFLLCIAFSGTWIGYESSWGTFGRRAGPPPAAVGQPAEALPAQGDGRRNRTVALSDQQIESMTATTLHAMQRDHPDWPIKVLRLRTFGQMKQGVVIAGGERMSQLVFDTDTGQPASLTEASYPKSNFPFGVQTHENMKHFHSGEMFGISGQIMNLLAGLSLLFLSVSGLTVYFQMWLKRRESGRNGFIWS